MEIKILYIVVLVVLLSGCIDMITPTTTTTTGTTLPGRTKYIPPSTTTITTLYQESTTTQTSSTTTTSTTTTTTNALKHQGKMSDTKRISTTTTSTTLPAVTEDMLDCRTDADCMITHYCCPCEFGGKVVAINKLYINIWRNKFSCPISIKCGWMKKPCWYRAVCEDKKCVKTLEQEGLD